MKKIYLDNAATTWPKPETVITNINSYFYEFAGSPKRSEMNSDIVEIVRQEAQKYFSASKVIFVPSATIGMNTVLNSLLHSTDHVITTNCEHHAVYRTLEHLKKTKRIQYDIVNYLDENQNELPDTIISAIKPTTKMIIMNHASNVTGKILNTKKIKNNINEDIILVVDVSQSCGFEDTEMDKIGADIIISSTHKHMYGIQGLGFIALSKQFNFEPFICGGTGKNSYLMEQPSNLPDIIEPGTANVPAILAFQAAMKFCSSDNRRIMQMHAKNLTSHFITNCKNIPQIILYLPQNSTGTGIIPFNIDSLDPNFVVSPYLLKNNIIIRSGLHCAPLIHKTIGTYPHGLNRASLSIFNTENEIDYLLNVLETLVKPQRSYYDVQNGNHCTLCRL